ncbi:MAG: alginate export family protein, partial [Planctomycetota bacterium]
RLGRQEISLDNDRFIGAVPWRQNHQSFDGLRVIAKDVGGVKIDYSAVSNVNRIFGDRSARGNELLNGHFANVSTDLGSVGRGTVYGYLVDFNDTQVLSTNTFGARVVGKHDVGSGKVGYVVEAAQQTDAFSNPVDVDADYLHLELNGSIEKFNVRIASETLGGSGDVGDKFSTPFATLHAFNGFADVFLNTPDGGLVDQFVTVSRPIAVGGLPGPIKLRASYHVFTSDAGSLDYGTELDLDAVIPLTDRAKLGLRYADFDADDAFADTTRFMAWLHVRVL